ncbi:hypothetical protein T484DRAFT_1890869 [Baffinella frigidus]|nr:hypothetical protein T484DRAFT_1890869 [Cryptophyta sp. CCMP2293]
MRLERASVSEHTLDAGIARSITYAPALLSLPALKASTSSAAPLRKQLAVKSDWAIFVRQSNAGALLASVPSLFAVFAETSGSIESLRRSGEIGLDLHPELSIFTDPHSVEFEKSYTGNASPIAPEVPEKRNTTTVQLGIQTLELPPGVQVHISRGNINFAHTIARASPTHVRGSPEWASAEKQATLDAHAHANSLALSTVSDGRPKEGLVGWEGSFRREGNHSLDAALDDIVGSHPVAPGYMFGLMPHRDAAGRVDKLSRREFHSESLSPPPNRDGPPKSPIPAFSGATTHIIPSVVGQGLTLEAQGSRATHLATRNLPPPRDSPPDLRLAGTSLLTSFSTSLLTSFSTSLLTCDRKERDLAMIAAYDHPVSTPLQPWLSPRRPPTLGPRLPSGNVLIVKRGGKGTPRGWDADVRLASTLVR